MLNIARVVDGVVVNIEIANQDWFNENDNVDGIRFIPYVTENAAHIGFAWGEETGFEQPDISSDPDIDTEIDDAIETGADQCCQAEAELRKQQLEEKALKKQQALEAKLRK